MKRLIVLLLILIPLASAVPNVTLQHSDIYAGETILGKIETTGEFVQQISSSDMKFFEGRKEIFIEHDIFFYDGIHYFYAYPNKVGNFTLKIPNILYKEGGILKSFNLEVPLNITDGSYFSEEDNATIKKILSIKPGFFYSLENPQIRLTNRGDVQLNVTYNGEVVPLQPEETKAVTVSPTSLFSLTDLSTYKDFSIPGIFLSSEGGTYKAPEVLSLKAVPKVLFANIILGNSDSQTIQFFNLGDDNITNVSISSSEDFIRFEGFDQLPARGIYNLSVEVVPTRDGYIGGNITITYNQADKNSNLVIPVSLFVLSEESESEDFNSEEETCSNAGGTVCGSGKGCDGRAIFTKSGEYCCLAECVDIGESSSEGGGISGWIIGLVILLVLGGTGYYFWRRSKKVRPESAEDRLKKSATNYSKRISGGIQRG